MSTVSVTAPPRIPANLEFRAIQLFNQEGDDPRTLVHALKECGCLVCGQVFACSELAVLVENDKTPALMHRHCAERDKATPIKPSREELLKALHIPKVNGHPRKR